MHAADRAERRRAQVRRWKSVRCTCRWRQGKAWAVPSSKVACQLARHCVNHRRCTRSLNLGPASFPGIFVQHVKPRGIADEAGLELGDQIVAVNGESNFEFNDAIALIKAASEMTLTVRKRVGLGLFTGHFEKVCIWCSPSLSFVYGRANHMCLCFAFTAGNVAHYSQNSGGGAPSGHNHLE